MRHEKIRGEGGANGSLPRHLPLDPSTNHAFNLEKCLKGRQDFRWRKLPDAYHSALDTVEVVGVVSLGTLPAGTTEAQVDDMMMVLEVADGATPAPSPA